MFDKKYKIIQNILFRNFHLLLIGGATHRPDRSAKNEAQTHVQG